MPMLKYHSHWELLEVPQVADFPKDAPARDLWTLSSLSLPARKTNQHVLREFNNSFGIVTCNRAWDEVLNWKNLV